MNNMDNRNDFGQANFPPVNVPGSGNTGTQELYPENMQDEVNEYYVHDKTLPRIKGVDYISDQDNDIPTPEEVSPFPYKY